MELISFDGFARSLNYGYERVRFPAPLPVGASVRMTARVLAVEPVSDGAQLRIEQTFQREGAEKPVCVAVSLARFYEEAA